MITIFYAQVNDHDGIVVRCDAIIDSETGEELQQLLLKKFPKVTFHVSRLSMQPPQLLVTFKPRSGAGTPAHTIANYINDELRPPHLND